MLSDACNLSHRERHCWSLTSGMVWAASVFTKLLQQANSKNFCWGHMLRLVPVVLALVTGCSQQFSKSTITAGVQPSGRACLGFWVPPVSLPNKYTLNRKDRAQQRLVGLFITWFVMRSWERSGHQSNKCQALEGVQNQVYFMSPQNKLSPSHLASYTSTT